MMTTNTYLVIFFALLLVILYCNYLTSTLASTKEGWDNCYNYARAHDNFMRKFTKPHWIAKIDAKIPQYTPYYDNTVYVPVGTLVDIKQNIEFPLFAERIASGGGVIFYYAYQQSGTKFIPFQYEKEIFTGDIIKLPNHPTELLVKLAL